MSVASKSIIYSLIFYTITALILILAKIKIIKIEKSHESLTINYLGEYNVVKDNKENRAYKNNLPLQNNKVKEDKMISSTVTRKGPNKIDKLLSEQELLAKEFADKLPTTNVATENTIQVINDKALYKKVTTVSKNALNNNSNNTNNTTLNTANHQSPYPNTANITEGSNFNIEGRILIKAPEINDKSSQTGIIAVSITVDNNGNVIEAKAGVEGTTIPSLELWKKCEQASLKSKYNAIKGVRNYQTGVIRFRFITY
ncbi:MAG: hypothetical protein ACQPRH_02010 [Solitalea-like symbiont of Tyrophagus putrescentiae]